MSEDEIFEQSHTEDGMTAKVRVFPAEPEPLVFLALQHNGRTMAGFEITGESGAALIRMISEAMTVAGIEPWE